MTLVKMYT